jgi:hypothetical protein
MVHRRRAAVLRLDIAAAVSSAARDLGPQGHAGHRADHRCERQAGAVRRNQPADRAPGRAHPSTCRRCRCPGILVRDTTPLPSRRHGLASRRPGQRTHRGAHPDAGRSARHPVLWLPKQAPELNAMDQLWRELKRLIAANRQAASADALASNAAGWVLGLTPQQARRKAGMTSAHFWLRNLVKDFWPPT